MKAVNIDITKLSKEEKAKAIVVLFANMAAMQELQSSFTTLNLHLVPEEMTCFDGDAFADKLHGLYKKYDPNQNPGKVKNLLLNNINKIHFDININFVDIFIL